MSHTLIQWYRKILFFICALFFSNFSFSCPKVNSQPCDQHLSFAFDVINGLSSKQKHLGSKYLYDDEGSRIFKEIMALKSYYPTQCEREILINQSRDIASYINNDNVNIIELGAGDGTKTIHLLSHFQNRKSQHLRYTPIDISSEAIRQLRLTLQERLVSTDFSPIVGDYLTALPKALVPGYPKNLLLFLGGNIGNFTLEESKDFLRSIQACLKHGDYMLLGADLKKEFGIMQMAYSDPKGVTARFNKNLLQRINRELEGNFNPESFKHHALYNPKSGAMESYLISTKKQNVFLKKYQINVEFDEYEGIYMECSKKFSLQELQHLATECGFQLVRNFSDSKNYFVDSLWRVNKTTL